MDAVTPEMVREAANKYFPASRANGKYVLLKTHFIVKMSA